MSLRQSGLVPLPSSPTPVEVPSPLCSSPTPQDQQHQHEPISIPSSSSLSSSSSALLSDESSSTEGGDSIPYKEASRAMSQASASTSNTSSSSQSSSHSSSSSDPIEDHQVHTSNTPQSQQGVTIQSPFSSSPSPDPTSPSSLSSPSPFPSSSLSSSSPSFSQSSSSPISFYPLSSSSSEPSPSLFPSSSSSSSASSSSPGTPSPKGRRLGKSVEGRRLSGASSTPDLTSSSGVRSSSGGVKANGLRSSGGRRALETKMGERLFLPSNTLFAFDLHHVLMKPQYGEMAKSLINYPDKKELLSAMFNRSVLSDFFQKVGRMVPERQMKELSTSSGDVRIGKHLVPLVQEVCNQQVPNSETFHIIRELKERGYKVVLFSNIGADYFRDLRAKFDDKLFEDFDGFYTTNPEDEYVMKPDPRVFQRFRERFNGENEYETIVFVDDSPKNIQTADADPASVFLGLLFRDAQQLRFDLEFMQILVPEN